MKKSKLLGRIRALEARVKALRHHLELAQVNWAADESWCRICRTTTIPRRGEKRRHDHEKDCPLHEEGD